MHESVPNYAAVDFPCGLRVVLQQQLCMYTIRKLQRNFR